ncbi:MAG: toast rack family protein [Bryobacteraceae bacterium]
MITGRVGWRVAAILPVLLWTGCQPPGPGEDRTERVVIEQARAAGAERISASIQIGMGELHVAGGAREFLEAEFAYNAPALKPQVRFDESGFRRRLVISHGNPPPAIGNVRNRWDIRLGGAVPLDLEVRCGAGENRLDLREVPLRSLEMHLGVGEVSVDLRGKFAADVDAKIFGGIGRAVVLVPASGVEASMAGGIGEIRVLGLEKKDGKWVSEAAGKTGGRLRLEVKGGIGEIEIRAE